MNNIYHTCWGIKTSEFNLWITALWSLPYPGHSEFSALRMHHLSLYAAYSETPFTLSLPTIVSCWGSFLPRLVSEICSARKKCWFWEICSSWCIFFCFCSLKWKRWFSARMLPCTVDHPGCRKASLPLESPSTITDSWGGCVVCMPAADVLLSCCWSDRGRALTDQF